VERCYELRTTRAERVSEGYCVGNVLASYVHVHFASSPAIASALVDRCRRRSAAL
jgi:cobyrinic acid a,c-diamide synthase